MTQPKWLMPVLLACSIGTAVYFYNSRDYIEVTPGPLDRIEVFRIKGGALQVSSIRSPEYFTSTVVHNAYSARSRTPFRCDGGQHSAVMADSVPR